MVFTDSHAHLTLPAFDPDRDEVLTRAREAGLKYLCTIASPLTDAAAALDLTGRYEFMYAAIGVHPHEAKHWRGDTAGRLESLASNPKVLAVGEIGLDYHYDHSPREQQREAFREQIRLARRLGLPVVIHTREAHEDTLEILEEEQASEVGGIFHCFSGTRAMADFALEHGFRISFAGNLTFKNALQLREVGKRFPSDRLLVETDAPFLSPHPYRGQRNEPTRVQEVVKELAGLQGIPAEKMGSITTENFESMFPRLRCSRA